jgi:uncharacterized BrkB/YihY/UPF0761 family membrane protein
MKPWYISIWDERQYIDLWSVNHTIAGILSLLVVVLAGIPILIGLPIMIFLAIGWEFFEYFKGIEETLSNRVTDVIIAITAFTIMYWIVQKYQTLNLIQVGAIFAAIALLLSVWGFWAMEAELHS